MMLPVWVAETEADAWEFVAAADRNQAKAAADHAWYGYAEIRVQRLWTDGSQGGRARGRVQVTVDTDQPGHLSIKQVHSIGYHACERCDEVWTADPSGLCEACEDEAQDEADAAMDLAHGERP